MADLQNLLDDSHESSVLGAIAHPAQVNILGAYAGAAETASRIYNVQDQQAQKAWGDALQQSVGPDGTVDYDKARTIAAADPLATMGMMKGLTGSAALAGSQQTQGANANGLMVNAITAALKGDDAGLHDRVAAGMQQLIDAGAVPRGRGMTALTRLPNDPTALRAHLERQRISLLPPGMQQPAIYGQPGSQTGAGGETIGTTQSQQTGAVTQAQPSGTGVTQGIPGANLDAPFTYQGPKGEQITTTLRKFYTDNGIKVPGAGTGGAGGVPDSLRPKPAPGAPPAATPPPATTPQQPGTGGGGPVVTSPAPAELEQQKADAANNAAAFQDISNRAVASRDRSSILGNMLGDTSQFSTGALSKITGNLRNVAISLGMPGINVEGQSAKESFNKLAAQLAQAQGAGAPSDARQAMAVSANPHEELSPAGADLMIRQLQGNEDYLQARAKLAGSGDQRDIKKFENETGVKLDPRAFQFARMKEGPQRKTWFNSLSKTDQAKVTQSYNFAHDQGLVSGP